MKGYRKRIADEILKRKLEGKGAVLIEGPKWCGKTTTAEQIAKSILYMDDPETKEQNITMSELSPKRLLRGETPRLIDEWQLAPKLWDAIRFEVDHRGELGQFVLTGSAVPPDNDAAKMVRIRYCPNPPGNALHAKPFSIFPRLPFGGMIFRQSSVQISANHRCNFSPIVGMIFCQSSD